MNFIRKPQQSLSKMDYPSLIKYMGSKSKIMNFVFEGINEVYNGGVILDVFAGSASLAGAISQQAPVYSNDIQHYSNILADTYNKAYITNQTPTAHQILEDATVVVLEIRDLSNIDIDYYANITLHEFQKLEEQQKLLINSSFTNKWHLFTKNYSGTWWSHEQCMWIDAIRSLAEQHKPTGHYPAIMSALMYAMAYASQGTGHYAQYRDAKTASSLKDILIYRRRSLPDYFRKKYDELRSYLPTVPQKLNHKSTHMDFKDCINSFEGGTVYADPPYCFVHYSRFYHALETLVLYDYPTLQIKGDKIVKGRYRDNRHQSPFCIKSKVKQSFEDLFNGVQNTKSNMVLSYSNTGMISMNEVSDLAQSIFSKRKIELLTTDHIHMTLGRKNDRQREVQECLILVT